MVAEEHGRRGIGIELKPAYVAMARARLVVASTKRSEQQQGLRVVKAAA